jgi:hypothetical protein
LLRLLVVRAGVFGRVGVGVGIRIGRIGHESCLLGALREEVPAIARTLEVDTIEGPINLTRPTIFGRPALV